MTMPKITPVPDSAFDINVLHSASRKAAVCPADISDLELAHLVLYDRAGAEAAAAAREQTARIAEIRAGAPRLEAPVAPQPARQQVIAEIPKDFQPLADGFFAALEGKDDESALAAWKDFATANGVLGAPLVLVGTIVEFFGKRVAVLARRCAELESRLGKVEAEPRGIKYLGVYDENRGYTFGDTVTCGGSLWVCKKRTANGKPGEDFEAWQCCVKRGKDGRDGKDAR